METEVKIISEIIIDFQNSGRTSFDALARNIIGGLNDNSYNLKTTKELQSEIIEEKMSLLSNLRCSYEDTYYIDLEWERLEKQLNELKD